jgi:serine/threonine protein kinase
MGEVYKARDTRLERLVAIKVLPADKVADATRKQRFMQEARAASALNHPNIVTVHDICDEGDIHFLVMEYVPGKTLEQMVPRKGLRLSDTLKYAVQIADALATAHSAGIVHRDVKPSNIMVADHGRVKCWTLVWRSSPSRLRSRPINPRAQRSPTRKKAQSWAARRICRRNRPKASQWARAATSFLSALCSTIW